MISTTRTATIAAMAMLTVSEAAKRSSLSRTHIRRLIADGVIKGVKVGPVWTVDERLIDRYLVTRKPRGRVPKSSG